MSHPSPTEFQLALERWHMFARAYPNLQPAQLKPDGKDFGLDEQAAKQAELAVAREFERMNKNEKR
jgi:hypothetical protein